MRLKSAIPARDSRSSSDNTLSHYAKHCWSKCGLSALVVLAAIGGKTYYTGVVATVTSTLTKRFLVIDFLILTQWGLTSCLPGCVYTPTCLVSCSTVLLLLGSAVVSVVFLPVVPDYLGSAILISEYLSVLVTFVYNLSVLISFGCRHTSPSLCNIPQPSSTRITQVTHIISHLTYNPQMAVVVLWSNVVSTFDRLTRSQSKPTFCYNPRNTVPDRRMKWHKM